MMWYLVKHRNNFIFIYLSTMKVQRCMEIKVPCLLNNCIKER